MGGNGIIFGMSNLYRSSDEKVIAIVYIILWAILKPRPTGGVIDV